MRVDKERKTLQRLLDTHVESPVSSPKGGLSSVPVHQTDHLLETAYMHSLDAPAFQMVKQNTSFLLHRTQKPFLTWEERHSQRSSFLRGVCITDFPMHPNPLEIPIPQIWGGARESAFPTSSRGVQMLQVLSPHVIFPHGALGFENFSVHLHA